MKIADLPTPELYQLLHSESDSERSMLIELFSRLPYYAISTALVVPIARSKTEDGKHRFNYIRYYRDIIAGFSCNDRDHLKHALADIGSGAIRSYLEREDRPFVCIDRNVVMVDHCLDQANFRRLLNTEVLRTFAILRICPQTETYNHCAALLSRMGHGVAIVGTKIVRNNMFDQFLNSITVVCQAPVYNRSRSGKARRIF